MGSNNQSSVMEQRAKQAVIAFGYVNKLEIGQEGVVGRTIPGFDLPEDDSTFYRLSGGAGVSQDGETQITNFVLEVSQNGADFEPKAQGIDIDVCVNRYKRDLNLEEEVEAAPKR